MSSAPTKVLPDVSPDQPPAPATGSNPLVSKIRHHLLFRDTITFLALTTFTVVLFSATLFLFRSFAAHQHQLALRWSERGRADLAAGHPEQAVASLRTALTYAPGERSDELLLAQALGDAGHTEESYTYFTGLWDRTPGDGFINLRLARLSATKEDREDAVNFYRAAVYGTWPGDAILRRQQVRLELAQYFIAQKQFAPAREELLVAGSNAGHNPELDRRVSSLLQDAHDLPEALTYSLKTIADQPANVDAAVAAARLSSQLGDSSQTLYLTEHALHLLTGIRQQTPTTAAAMKDMRALRSDLDRLQALDPSEALPSAERARRLLADAAIARERLTTCLPVASPPPAGAAPASSPLTDLITQWTALQPTLTQRLLSRDHDAQDTLLRLIDSTETVTNSACGAPTGDDALLLRLARQSSPAGSSAAQPTQP